MKSRVLHSVFLIGLILSPLAAVYASSSSADSAHFCQPVNPDQWQRDHPLHAAKRTADLNVGVPGTVRAIYVLPNDRAPRQDINAKLDTELKDAQLLFADLMEKYGFGRKTFRFETDTRGRAVVHHVNGKFDTEHYHNSALSVLEELTEQFDLSKNIYLVTLDAGREVDAGGGKSSNCFANHICGLGSWNNGGAGGFALVPANDDPAVAHELGHAFGLQHDYRAEIRENLNNADPMLSSFCAAEWLDASRYFNTYPTSVNTPATVRILPPRATSSYGSIRLRFEINDPDGSHQAQLLTRAIHQYKDGGVKLTECKSLNGESNTVVEFVTSELTGVSETAGTVVWSVWLNVTDLHGNLTRQSFSIDITSLAPSDVVSIPDANLATAIRRELDLSTGETITQLDMLSLTRRLEGNQAQITDLTGLEHAVNLKDLSLFYNRISDLSPLEGLTQLWYLALSGNLISDVTPLAGLTQLRRLNLNDNQISDVTPLAGLTRLRELNLDNNQIGDVTPLAGLVNLETFSIGGNPITTIPGAATVDFGLASGEETIIEGRKFTIIYSGGVHNPSTRTVGRISLNPADPFTVRYLNLDALLHSDNLAGFFAYGGTIELLTTTDTDFGDVVISEISWGLNGGSTADQWIELYNTTPNAITLDPGDMAANWLFRFRYGHISEWRNIQGYWKVVDRVSNADWKVPGQSGNTARNQPLVSMYRTIDYEKGHVPDGTLASSWKASTGRVNLLSPSYGTPGAIHSTPDFDGDGSVGFSDFVQFAAKFGLSRGDAGYDARFDLDGDGTVGFGDFVIFAGRFGQGA